MVGKTRTNLRNCQRFYERFFCQRFFYFFATPVAERATYDAVTKKLRQSPVSASCGGKLICKIWNPNASHWWRPVGLKVGVGITSWKSRPQPRCRSKICSLVPPIHAWSAELYTKKTFGSQPHATIKRDAEFCRTLSSDWRPRRPCTYMRKRINTQADSGHGLTRGFNDRTGNSTESAWRPSGHFLAVICRSNQAKRTSRPESLYVFTMWKTRPHCSRVSQFKPTPRPFQRAMLRMREVRTLRPWMWKLCAFKLARAVSRNHRPVGSPETSKNCDFIS
jgi:hypothetical protein